MSAFRHKDAAAMIQNTEPSAPIPRTKQMVKPLLGQSPPSTQRQGGTPPSTLGQGGTPHLLWGKGETPIYPSTTPTRTIEAMGGERVRNRQTTEAVSMKGMCCL